MHSRRTVMVMTGCALAIVALSVVVGKTPLLFWNMTASVPRGLYIVTRAVTLERGDLVSAWLPSDTRALAAERRYLPLTVPVIKPVSALSGDTVCATDRTVFVDGIAVATRREHDHADRPMPWWTGCKNLSGDDVFLLSNHSADSFDGRYFGPIARAEIIAVLRPLWTF
jgi:conjugative transfer signal peptidase TraF